MQYSIAPGGHDILWLNFVSISECRACDAVQQKEGGEIFRLWSYHRHVAAARTPRRWSAQEKDAPGESSTFRVVATPRLATSIKFKRSL
jgi:hypothetical protein